jgi:hypothetical protein
LTVVKNKVNRPNACFTTLCQSTDFDDQSNLSPIVQRPTKKVSHHLNVSVKKALITHLDFNVTQKWWLIFFAGHCTVDGQIKLGQK